MEPAANWIAAASGIAAAIGPLFTGYQVWLQIDLARMLLLPAALLTGHTGAPLADLVYLDLEPGADTGPAAAAAAAGGGTLVPTAQFHAVLDAEGDRLNTLATIALLGMALLYTAIGIANTLLMATSGRARDVTVLRLSGATPSQVLRMIGAEAVLVTALGAVLAVAAVVPAVAGLVVAPEIDEQGTAGLVFGKRDVRSEKHAGRCASG